MKSRFIHSVALLMLGVAYSFNVYSQGYPDKPINLVVAQAPGGSADVNARLLAESLGKILKQPVIVQNKPGVGGAIGSAQVANSKPDGYTLLLTQAGTFTYPEAEKLSGKKPLYELNQLEPIAQITDDPTILIVRTDSRWKTYEDLIKEAKLNPGKLTYGSSGNFGPAHLSVEMLANAAGVKFSQIPFGGGGPANMAMLAGTVDFSVAPPSLAIPQITGGKARPLLNSGSKRIKALPNIPTYKEAGFNAQFSFSSGLAVPTGTPAPIVAILRDAVRQAVQSPEFISKTNTQFMEVTFLDTNEFKAFINEDTQRIIGLLKKMDKVD
jgi:tripartite-type tricarboxylate transporter receptor subunit TctC